VLALRPDDLEVMKVDKVGWSDLGEPSRVLKIINARRELWREMSDHYAR